jgi:solute:Na+ symporter, SSS family
MHFLDILIFFVYMAGMLGIGFFFMKKNENADDYYVGGREMGSVHVGLSVVATDVGGGFSIGLGGLGFMIGLSGSWMLFTGLIGAWLSAVILIPKVNSLENFKNLLTFPQIFESLYNKKVAFIAAIISAIGYLGFTSSQILAGAKLASASFVSLNLDTALWIMGLIVIGYTALGGMKAVIYTDTVQWIILMGGLIFVGLPFTYFALGGYDKIMRSVPPEFFSFTNVSWQTLVNWAVTIIPIWFVGMTLYQRIYACKDEKTAKCAWFIAGLFEWPLMALMGVLLGIFGRVAADSGAFTYLGFGNVASMDPEMGLPMLLRTILPVGLMGIMMSAYFSAIMSTADSCLMAASGNVVSDLYDKLFPVGSDHKKFLRISQIFTLLLGLFSLLIATTMQNVLQLMLYSYAFMVSGLFVPLIAALFFNKRNSTAATSSMLLGGFTTILLIIIKAPLPFGLDPNIFGITTSALTFIIISSLSSTEKYELIEEGE